MKNWQLIALCLSIFVSTIAGTFYLKYEPKTLLESNYGPVDLGKVYSEKVMIDVTLIGMNDNGSEKILEGASYYEKDEPVNNTFIDLVDRWNISRSESDKLSFSTAQPTEDNKVKLKIRTYIAYSSSNFMNLPYTFTVYEKTYPLSKNESLEKSVKSIVSENFENTRKIVSEHLFMTDNKSYKLNLENETDSASSPATK
ncbi:hypothetical protein [Acinetobacter guillouiae]|uniref:hypothetical protein n=1 Tax=Acinetobacter guillouiae TaxID=106649 RepID=UPI003AF57EB1